MFGNLSAGADTASNVTRSAGSGDNTAGGGGGGGGEAGAGTGGGKGSSNAGDDDDVVEIVGAGGDGGAAAAAPDDDGAGLLEEAGITAKECKNIFTELRKGANHPLMLLNHFKGGGKLEQVVEVLHRTGYFGGQATKDMVSNKRGRGARCSVVRAGPGAGWGSCVLLLMKMVDWGGGGGRKCGAGAGWGSYVLLLMKMAGGGGGRSLRFVSPARGESGAGGPLSGYGTLRLTK